MNLDSLVISRDNYTILDCLSDVGGLLFILLSGFAFLLTIWNFHHAENFLVTKLYRLSASKFSDDEIVAGKQSLMLKTLPIRNICEYCTELLPHKIKGLCRCLHSDQLRGFQEGRRILNMEANCYIQLRQHRYFNNALVYLLNKKQRKKLWDASRFVEIHDDRATTDN